MSNFKSGSGNLDFGGENESGDPNGNEQPTDSTASEQSEPTTSDKPDTTIHNTEASETSEDDPSMTASAPSTTSYPYFVRRNNVGDERDTRLEIHVRDKVADREGKFRNELAEQLGTNEVSKTDAREFALLAAFQHPERVAELMRDEGFGALD
ncbi:acyl-CoA dehydrogenase [Halogeometricum sp. CBA1124]|uniref:acyl-CoA dehydrogenase n=1 Tax=Halogeometricum sp. CBA1124 TaxID=2668071 RepID=UPI001429CCAD|nr:acyl-CoA dehydrogenase [Halogeometricum sp. CBA1124]MUV56213.1 acyl-CoA dehydrogenase [Halogeometricum sp. CBA1124]